MATPRFGVSSNHATSHQASSPLNNSIRYLPLICLAALHTVVDTTALLIEPLWGDLEVLFKLGAYSLGVVIIAQSLPTSVSQGVFGFLRDRRSASYLLWLGPLTAAICLTSIGLFVGPGRTVVLCGLLIIGGIGVGAFHPEAAVTVGRLIPGHRTRSLSIFMFGGSIGLALGPTLSGTAVRSNGLLGLLMLTPVFVVLIPLLWLGTRSGLATAETSGDPIPTRRIGEMLDQRIGLALLLLLACSIRLVPNLAMNKVLAFTLANRDYDTQSIGLTQSMFLISASVGMFLIAVFFPAGWERRFMIICPLAGIPLLAVLGAESCPQWLFLGTLMLTGLVLWGTTPAMVSYAQQLFPRGVGLASAITMGLAWGVGGLIQTPITVYFQNAGTPQRALHAFIPFLLLGAVGAWLLPSLLPPEATTTEPGEQPSVESRE